MMKVKIDVAEAQRQLDGVRASASRLGGGLDGLQKSFGQVKERMEKQAGAFAALSLAMGSNNDSISKGIAGVGQLAAAYGAGGPLALALAAGSAAVSALTKHWDDLIAAQDRALEKQYSAVAALARSNQAASGGRGAAEQRYLSTLNRGSGSITAIREGYATQIADAEAAAAAAYGRSPGNIGIGPEADRAYQNWQAEVKIAQDTVDELKRAMAYDIAAYKLDRQERIGAAAREASVEAKRIQEQMNRERLAREKEQEDSLRSEVEYAQKWADYEKEAYEREKKAEKDADKEELRRAKEMADEKKRITKEAADEAARIQEQQVQQMTGLASSFAASVGVLAVEAAAGQQEAFANFVKAASQAAGGFIMLKGGEVMASGIQQIALSGGADPRGYAFLAGGAALVAAGAAVQAAGPAAVGQIAGVKSAGGGAGGAMGGGGGGASEPGLRSARGGGRSNGGGATVINITYAGNSGPTADDGARAVVSGLRRADRRGLTPVRVY